MEEKRPHPYLDKLLKRPIVKSKKEFIVHIKPNLHQPNEVQRHDVDVHMDAEKEDELGIATVSSARKMAETRNIQPSYHAKNTHQIEFVDERNVANIDRDLIMIKMMEQMGIYDNVKTMQPSQYNPDDKLNIFVGVPLGETGKDNLKDELKKETSELKELETNAENITPVDVEKTLKEIEKNEEIRKELTRVFDGIGEESIGEMEEEVMENKPRKNKVVETEKKRVLSSDMEKMMARLPPPDKIVLRVSNHYMENRKMYAQKLVELFKEYNKELLNEESNISCDPATRSGKEQLMIHQRVAREYLNLYTPYRGLLLFYGLGAGKTLASIAIAEGMKSQKKIILMTPASLKSNYMTELKKYGEQLYRKNQYWEFISIEGRPEYVPILSGLLSLKREFILKNKGAFLVDVTKKESNFQDFSPKQQELLDMQLEEMIRAKYLDINYNGLNNRIFNELTENEKKNPFDNSVVIIDEAHNFVSWIVNKLNKPREMAAKMYDYLMDAENARIVLLSGTPIINYPNEIAVMFNILRGYIKTWEFQITSKNFDKEQLLDYFDKENFKIYDYIDYTNGKLTITRNPFGFVNTKRAVNATKDIEISERKAILEYEVPKTVVKRKNKASIIEEADTVVKPDAKTEAKPEEKPDEKSETKLPGHTTMKVIKRKTAKKETETVEQKAGASKKHNKTQKKDKSIDELFVVKDGMIIEKYHEPNEESAFDSQEDQKEILQYMNNMGESQMEIYKGGMQGGDVLVSSQYKGVYFKDEQGNISDSFFLNKIKQILTKYDITFAPTIQVQKYKCLPDNPDEFNSMFVDKDSQIIRNVNLFKKRILGLTSYFRSAQEGLLPSFILDEHGSNYHMEKCEMSDHQFKEYTKYRVAEIQEQDRANMKMAKKGKEDEEIKSTYRIYSRSACNFTFPDAVKRPMPEHRSNDESEGETELSLKNANTMATYDIEKSENEIQDDADDEAINREKVDIPNAYADKIKHAMEMLKSGSNMEPHPLSRDGLAIYSPKFLRILDNVTASENKGMHLLYSDFLTLEGINIFKLVLEENGYVEFKIKKVGNDWDIDGWENEEWKSKPKFIRYTGQATTQEKEILRNIWNSDWKFVPATIVNKIESIAKNNHMGEIARVLMITAAGAEGINLKNTRFVHIMESYWNMVRIDQVVGRARRICSHNNLPKELQNVKVFYYLSTFSKKQIDGKENKDVMIRDTDKKGHPITTDEHLFMKSMDKDFLNRQLLKAVKETAIDCNLYSKTRESEKLVCYGFGKVKSNDFSSFPRIEDDEKIRDELNVKEQKLVLKKISIKKDGKEIKFIQDQDLNVYDYDVYENSGILVVLGKLVPRGRGQMFVPTQKNLE